MLDSCWIAAVLLVQASTRPAPSVASQPRLGRRVCGSCAAVYGAGSRRVSVNQSITLQQRWVSQLRKAGCVLLSQYMAWHCAALGVRCCNVGAALYEARNAAEWRRGRDCPNCTAARRTALSGQPLPLPLPALRDTQPNHSRQQPAAHTPTVHAAAAAAAAASVRVRSLTTRTPRTVPSRAAAATPTPPPFTVALASVWLSLVAMISRHTKPLLLLPLTRQRAPYAQ